MLKKVVQFEDLDGNLVQETFYFNFNKLEISELMELEQLEEKIARLSASAEDKGMSEPENTREAYEIFKDLILRAYGEKGADNRSFIKTPELRKKLEGHMAFPEIIFEFLQNPEKGAEFVEKCLPASYVAAAKAELEKRKSPEEIQNLVEEAAKRQADPETAVAPGLQSVPDPVDPPQELRTENTEPSDEELLKMNPKDMTQEQLLRAFQIKNQQ